MRRITNSLTTIAIVTVVITAAMTMRTDRRRALPHSPSESSDNMARQDVSSGTHETSAHKVSATGERFTASIRKPLGPPLIELGQVDPHGRTATVACSTCHSVREPKLDNSSPNDLDEFHQGLKFSHGQLTCYACHNPDNADHLRLADGTTVEYRDVMSLCSQCHGPQATAFAHGAHGGMTGFWDLSRGPQQRNNCIDCHDPHSPSFPKMIVTFKPQDRFLGSSNESPQQTNVDSQHAEH